MKNTLISALTVLVASTAIAPIASAVEPGSFNIQEQRLEALDLRTKTTVPDDKIKVEYLNNQTKANPVENIQEARLNAMDARTKADPVENIQEARLNAMDARTKANPVDDIQEARLNALDARTKANPVENIQEARLNAMDARTKSVLR